MGDHLPVGEGGVGGRRHGGEVGLTLRRAERCAGELAVGDANAVARHGFVETAEIVRSDLMPESARAAVEHDEHLPGAVEPESWGHPGIVEAVRPEGLDLQVVVPRPQGAELLRPALDGACAHVRRVRAW